MTEESVSLVFFQPSHYLVQPISEGEVAIFTMFGRSADDFSDEEAANIGPRVERVTKAELFERWPYVKAIEEQLLKRLAEKGSS